MSNLSTHRRLYALPEAEGQELYRQLQHCLQQSQALHQQAQQAAQDPLLEPQQRATILGHVMTLGRQLSTLGSRSKGVSTTVQTASFASQQQEHLTDLNELITSLAEQRDALKELQAVHAAQQQKLEQALTEKQAELGKLEKAQRAVSGRTKRKKRTQLFEYEGGTTHVVPENITPQDLLRARTQEKGLSREQRIVALRADIPHFERRLQEWKVNPRFQGLDVRIAEKDRIIQAKQAKLTQLQAQVTSATLGSSSQQTTPLPMPDLRGLQHAAHLLRQRPVAPVSRIIALADSVHRSVQRMAAITNSGGAITNHEDTVYVLGQERDQAQQGQRNAEAERDTERKKRKSAEDDADDERKKRKKAEGERDDEKRERRAAENERDASNRTLADLRAENKRLREWIVNYQRDLEALKRKLNDAADRLTEMERELRKKEAGGQASADVGSVQLSQQLQDQRLQVLLLTLQLEQERDRKRQAETALQNNQQEINRLQQAIALLRAQLAGATSRAQHLEWQRDQANRERDQAWQRNQTLEDELRRRPQHTPQQNDSLAALLVMLSNQLNMLPSELAKLINQPGSTNDKKERKKRKKLKIELQSLEAKCQTLQAENSSYLAQLHELEHILVQLRERLQTLSDENEALRKRVDFLEDRNTALATQLVESEDARRETAQLLEDERGIRGRLEQERDELRKRIKQLLKRLGEIEEENKGLKGELADEQGRAASSEAQVQEKDGQIASLGGDFVKILHENRDLKEKLRQAQEEIARLEEEIARRDAEILRLSEALESTKELLAGANLVIEQQNDELASARKRIAELEAQLAAARKAQQEAEKRANDAEEGRETLQNENEALQTELQHVRERARQFMDLKGGGGVRVIEHFETIEIAERLIEAREIAVMLDLTSKQALKLLAQMIPDPQMTRAIFVALSKKKEGNEREVQNVLHRKFQNGADLINHLIDLEISGEMHLEQLPLAVKALSALGAGKVSHDKQPQKRRWFRRASDEPLKVADMLKANLPPAEYDALLVEIQKRVGLRRIKNASATRYMRRYPKGFYPYEATPGLKQDMSNRGEEPRIVTYRTHHFYGELTTWYTAELGDSVARQITQYYLNEEPDAFEQVLECFLPSEGPLPEPMRSVSEVRMELWKEERGAGLNTDHEERLLRKKLQSVGIVMG